MKKQRILALGLGTVIGLGSIFGAGASYADELNKVADDCVGIECAEDEEMDFNEEILKNNILSQVELKQYNDAVDQMMKLYDNIEDKEMTDQVLDDLVKAEEKIYQDNKVVFDKVDSYFDSLYDAPGNITAEEVANFDGTDDFNDVDVYTDDDFYKELTDNNVLNADELALLKEAESKLDALYQADFDENDLDNIISKEDAIYNEYKAIYDKVDMYFTSLDQMELDNYYNELVQSGDLTKEQVEQLKAADKKVDELYENLSENPSDEELDELDKKIQEIYKDIDFVDCFDCDDEDMMLY